MDYTQLQCPPFSKDEADMIVSTRIRVGRNLADFPLGPGVSKDQRSQIEQFVVKACSKFTGELEGKYYSLATMTPDE
jgi:creatine kinase/arginine kinase